MARLKVIYHLLMDALFPRACVVCKKEGEILCQRCAKNVTLPPWHREKVCEGVEIFSRVSYQEPAVQKMLHAWKYRGDEEAGKWWQKWMQEGEMFFLDKETVLIPVPLAREAYAERGFNQAEMLAQSIAAKGGWTVVEGLKRVPKKAQAKTKKEDRGEVREKNPYMSALRPQDKVPKSVCLVDDVATTGSTLVACADVLRQAGVSRVYACTLAYGNDA
ncbi:ComF family protein [bacterium]|nr:ComF family protein [bacterium]NBX49208.1 ComF family protein [bacterium]